MKYTYSSWLSRWVPRPPAALALLLATASASYAQTPAATFAPVATFSMGADSTPTRIAVADVNGDSNPDLLTLNASGGSAFSNTVVAVRLGNGNGTFRNAAIFDTGSYSVSALAVADVNGDSNLDLLTTNTGSSSAGVLLGNGNGTFRTATTFGTGLNSNPYNIAVADVNGDGKPDLLTANASSSMVAVLPGNGNGTFQAAATFSTGPNSFPYSVVVADVNGDSKSDLLTANFSNGSAGVLLGNGDGTFQPAATFAIGPNSKPYDIAVADVNGDGNLDLLTANAGSDSAGVLLGNGDGTFQAVAIFGTGSNSSPRSVAVGDVNGDGKLDLLTANSGSTVAVLLGKGDGAFQTAATFSTGPNSFPNNIVVADVNGDSKLDLLTANIGTNSAGVLLNTTVYAAPAPTLTSLSPTSGPVGTSITLTGTDLTGATAVSFNGTAATTFSVVNSTTITATVPTGATSGNVTVTTPAGTSGGVAFTVQTAAPTLTSPVSNSTTNGQPTLAGTAPAGSTVTIYLAMGSGAAQAIGTTTATGSSFSFVSATALASGIYSVYATAQASGQAVSANSTTTTFTVDATAPTATLSTTATSPTATSPIPFTVTFSEPVTGFSASRVSVTNGTITSAITTTGNAYSFSVTPTTGGVVTVNIFGNVVRDVVGNGNAPGGPLSVTYAALITATTWTGALSTDWFTAGNWSAGVPTPTADATINPVSTGRYPLVAIGTAAARNLTLNAGASLRMSDGTLDVRGNLTNNGAFVATGGTVVLGTSTLGNIVGSSTTNFWNLQVASNSARLATSAGATVQQALTLNGRFATNFNSFTLLSNATGTALVVNRGGVVEGPATVQRAIDSSVNPGPGYRHYSSPVSTSFVSNFATSSFTPVVNPAYNMAAAPAAVSPFPTIFGYDDSRLRLANDLNSFDKGYFSPASRVDLLMVGRGYSVNIAASEVVAFNGYLNYGPLTLPLTSSRPTYPEGGWQLLGNPYPAPLDYSLVDPADRPGLESAIYVYSSTSQYAGRYRTYVNGIGNPVLPVGQAFFARVAAGQASATLTFRESQRLTAPDNTPFQRTAADPRPLVQLTLKATDSPHVADEFYAYAESGATPALDSEFDAVKLPNTNGFHLAGVAATGESLAVDARATFTATTELPLTVGVPAAGSYSLGITALANLPAGLTAYLRDAQTGQTTQLTAGTSYNFSVSAAEAQALVLGRFAVVFSPQTTLATTSALSAEAVSVYPNPAHSSFAVTMPGVTGASAVQAELVNTLGQVVRRQSAALPASGTSFSVPTTELAAGVYVLRLQAGDTTLTKRVVVQ